MSPNPDKILEHGPNQISCQCGKVHTDELSQIIGKRLVIDIPVIKASVIKIVSFQRRLKKRQHQVFNFLHVRMNSSTIS